MSEVYITQSFYSIIYYMTSPHDKRISKLYDRISAIFFKEAEALWLSTDVPVSGIMELCDKFPGVEIDMYRVTKDINKIVNNHCDLILPENSF